MAPGFTLGRSGFVPFAECGRLKGRTRNCFNGVILVTCGEELLGPGWGLWS